MIDILYFTLYVFGHLSIILVYMYISHTKMCNKLVELMYTSTIPKPKPRYEIRPVLNSHGSTVYHIVDTVDNKTVYMSIGMMNTKSKLIEMNNL